MLWRHPLVMFKACNELWIMQLLWTEHIEIMKQKTEGESLTMEDVKKIKYTWQVARESMRLFPPIFGSFRKAIVDIEFQGFTIPRGWKVIPYLYLFAVCHFSRFGSLRRRWDSQLFYFNFFFSILRPLEIIHRLI